MNFENLYAPYATKEAPNVGELIKWLLKNGIPQHIADQAMLSVFTAIQNGMEFKPSDKHSATWHLWTHTLKVARDFHDKELVVYVKKLEEFHSKLSEQIDAEWNTLSKWQKIKQVIQGKA